MSDSSCKSRNRFRVFSLRSLMVVIAMLACFFAIFAFQMGRYRRNNTAIMDLRNAGVPVYVVDSRQRCSTGTEVKPPSVLSVLRGQPAAAGVVDFSDPSLSAADIQALLPSLRTLIRTSLRPELTIILSGNPSISVELSEEMREQLPCLKFPQYTPVPNGTKNAIQIGMSKAELISTAGKLNVKYTNASGNETWTYFTDELGIGLLGVDFDENSSVVDVWTSQGIPQHRRLTEVDQGIIVIGL